MKMHFLRVMEYLSVKLSFISLCIVLFQKEFQKVYKSTGNITLNYVQIKLKSWQNKIESQRQYKSEPRKLLEMSIIIIQYWCQICLQAMYPLILDLAPSQRDLTYGLKINHEFTFLIQKSSETCSLGLVLKFSSTQPPWGHRLPQLTPPPFQDRSLAPQSKTVIFLLLAAEWRQRIKRERARVTFQVFPNKYYQKLPLYTSSSIASSRHQ